MKLEAKGCRNVLVCSACERTGVTALYEIQVFCVIIDYFLLASGTYQRLFKYLTYMVFWHHSAGSICRRTLVLELFGLVNSLDLSSS